MIDVAIVGAGPAGLSAGIYAARAGLSTTVFEELTVGGQLTSIDSLENYPGFAEGVGGFEIAFSLRSQAERFGATIISEQVVDVAVGERDGSQLFTLATTGGAYEAKTVIIATGAKPRPLPIAGTEDLVGRGLSYCATCDGNFFRDRDVAVFGGGDTACADSVYLSRIARSVHLIHRRHELRAAPWYAAQLVGITNLTKHFGCVVSGVHTEGGALSGIDIEDVATGEKTPLAVQGLFVAIGTMPQTQWLADVVDLDGSGYIATHGTVHTSQPGIFAAGDVRTSPLRQVVTAASDGALAAEAAAEFLAS